MSEQALERIPLALPTGKVRIHDKRIDRPSKAVREAVRLMIDEGKAMHEAAALVDLPTKSLRLAFEKPAIRQYVKRQLDVFRAATNAKNIYRLAEIRDAANNMPAVNAIKELESQDVTRSIAESGTRQTPGIVINVISNSQNTERCPVTIEQTTLENNPDSAREILTHDRDGGEGEKPGDVGRS